MPVSSLDGTRHEVSTTRVSGWIKHPTHDCSRNPPAYAGGTDLIARRVMLRIRAELSKCGWPTTSKPLLQSLMNRKIEACLRSPLRLPHSTKSPQQDD